MYIHTKEDLHIDISPIYVNDFINYCGFEKTLNSKIIKTYSITLRHFFKNTSDNLEKVSKYVGVSEIYLLTSKKVELSYY